MLYTVYVNLNSASNGLKTNKTPKVLQDFDREFTALIGTFCDLLSLWVMNLWYIIRNYISLVQYIYTFLTNLLLGTRYKQKHIKSALKTTTEQILLQFICIMYGYVPIAPEKLC